MSRRGENIFKRKDGRWEARILERRADGSQAYRSIYGKGYAEVKAKKEEYLKTAPVFSAPGAKKLATFDYLADKWLFSVKGSVKESSYTRYHRNVYSYLLPALGRYSDTSSVIIYYTNKKQYKQVGFKSSIFSICVRTVWNMKPICSQHNLCSPMMR